LGVEPIAVGGLFVIASIVRHQHMNRKLHKICRLDGPSLLVKPARYAAADMDPIAGPSAEQAEKEFADENWRDDSGAPQARQPKRRHIGAVSAIVGAAFDAATTPAARKHLSKQALALPMRVTSANRASPANYFWATFLDHWKRFTRDGSEKCAAPARRSRSLYRNAERRRDRAGSASQVGTGLSLVLRVPTGAVSGRMSKRRRICPALVVVTHHTHT